jgi:site-specific recombinase XerD
MSAGTAANRYSALQQFFKWAVEEGIIGRSPMAVMRPPEVPEVLVDVLPDDKIKALLKVCAGKDFPARRDTAMIRLFLEPGGLRVSEMVGLTVPAVDFDQDVVLVLGKGRRPRSVPFGARTGQALERYVRDRARHKWAHVPALWLGARGPMTRSGALQMLHRRGEQAGVGNVFPHMLRHTAATDWLDAGGQETDAMRLFGWKSRQMVGRYASKTADTRAAKAARRMSRGDRY